MDVLERAAAQHRGLDGAAVQSLHERRVAAPTTLRMGAK